MNELNKLGLGIMLLGIYLASNFNPGKEGESSTPPEEAYHVFYFLVAFVITFMGFTILIFE